MYGATTSEVLYFRGGNRLAVIKVKREIIDVDSGVKSKEGLLETACMHNLAEYITDSVKALQEQLLTVHW